MERRQPEKTPEQWSEVPNGSTNPPASKARASDDKNNNMSNHKARPMCITQEDGPDQDDQLIPDVGPRRSERVKSQVRPSNAETHHIANMAAMNEQMQGLVLTAQARMKGFTMANRHLQMNEWAFEEFLLEPSQIKLLERH